MLKINKKFHLDEFDKPFSLYLLLFCISVETSFTSITLSSSLKNHFKNWFLFSFFLRILKDKGLTNCGVKRGKRNRNGKQFRGVSCSASECALYTDSGLVYFAL